MFTPACKVFAAFENIQSGADRSEFDGILARIPVKMDNTMFDFSLFWKEQAWAYAVNAATNADLIIISLSGRADLPVPVKRWMESWPHFDQEDHVALVLVLEKKPEDFFTQNALIAYCQNLAENHGLSFFCHRGDMKSFAGELSGFESDRTDAVRSEKSGRIALFSGLS